jgi:5'-nucleotidase / UDP-sugar diphosphatase
MKYVIFVFTVVILILFSTLFYGCKTTGNSSTLTILHTNDTHSSLDDIGRRAVLVKQVREEVGKENVLLVDSGDVFTGTLYFTLSQGQSDLWFMQYLGYDAMGLGNHEFDKGPQILSDFVSKAGFPVVCANLDFSKEVALAGKISPWTIVQKHGEKYGLFGLVTENTNELSSPGKNITISDTIDSARGVVTELKKQGINKIIALSQIGWERDIELARQVQDIDIIVGGHSATVPDVYPTVINPSSAPTLVVQAGSQGKYLGQLNVTFNKNGVVTSWNDSRLLPVDQNIEADPVCVAKLEEYQKPIKQMLSTILGKTQVTLDGDRGHVRSEETNLGNMVADAILNKTRPLGVTIAIVNGGAIRNSVPSGDFSLGQVLEIMPYGNYVMVIELSGRQIVSALENGVSQVEQAAGRFPQVAGMRYIWNPRAAVGSRIVSVDIKNGDSYQPINLSAVYGLATIDFLAGGGDGYTVFKETGKYNNTGLLDYEVLEDYIKSNSPLNPVVEGRILLTGN